MIDKELEQYYDNYRTMFMDHWLETTTARPYAERYYYQLS